LRDERPDNPMQAKAPCQATTMWQIRARQAEEQLKQLTAGTNEPEPDQEPTRIDSEAPQLLQESDTVPTGVLAWWKRFWRHVEGA